MAQMRARRFVVERFWPGARSLDRHLILCNCVWFLAVKFLPDLAVTNRRVLTLVERPNQHRTTYSLCKQLIKSCTQAVLARASLSSLWYDDVKSHGGMTSNHTVVSLVCIPRNCDACASSRTKM